jgi:hypothetical protein
MSMVLGQNASCAVSTDNKAYYFGSNATGIISKDNDSNSILLHTQVQKDKRFMSLILGIKEACEISSLDYTAQCSGG